MKQKELCTELKNYVQIRDFIEGLLNRKTIDERTRFETMLVFEALYNDMLEKGVPEATMVTVLGKKGPIQRIGPFFILWHGSQPIVWFSDHRNLDGLPDN